MVLPAPDFPIVEWDGNEQNIINDGPFNPKKAQAADYNKVASEVQIVERTLREGYVLAIRNQTGGTLVDGDLIRVSNVDTGGVPTVSKALATLSTTLADGVVIGTIADGAFGNIATRFLRKNVNTQALGTPGTQLFLSDTMPGAVSATPGAVSQVVARIAKQDPTTGSIFFCVDTGGIGGGGGTPSQDNKEMPALVTSSDGDQATNTTVVTAPVNDGYVAVFVNGIKMDVGDGVKTKDCYFSGNGGTTARNISDIDAGDTLHWNGSVTGFQLATTDKIDLDYDI